MDNYENFDDLYKRIEEQLRDLPEVPSKVEVSLEDPRIHTGQFHCTWDVTAHNVYSGDVTGEQHGENLIVKAGRADALYLLFALAGSAACVSLAAGASSTAATVNDTQLAYEHILNGSRKSLTNTAAVPVALTASDVVDDIYVDGFGVTYYKKIVVQAIYLVGDANNGHPFQEYGLFTLLATPGTPSGTSGVMFNRFVAGSPITKDASTQITVNVTIRV